MIPEMLPAPSESSSEKDDRNPSGICGPNDYAFGSVTCMVRDFALGKMNMGIEGTFNSVDVRDLADGVISACEKGRRGE